MADPSVAPRTPGAVNWKAEEITALNFPAKLHDVECPACFRVGFWALAPQPNASGVTVRCDRCGHQPWPGRYLVQDLAKPRRVKSPEAPRETWRRCGDYCYVCQTALEDLPILKAHYEQHHAQGYAETEHAGPLIPVCSACHVFVSVLQYRHRVIIEAAKMRRGVTS